jgi:hypothetical protein
MRPLPFAASSLLVVGAALVLGTSSARAANEGPLEAMAACQQSWLDWKQDPAAAVQFRDWFLPRFDQEPRSPAWKPRQAFAVFGLPGVQVYPQSVGMALGFSVEVRADGATARRAMEAAIGRPMRCEKSDGEWACEAKLGERRIAMLMSANEGRGPQTLIGCFYYYQQ